MLLAFAWTAATLFAAADQTSGDDDVIVASPGERGAYWVLDRSTVEHNVHPKDVPRGAVGCSAVVIEGLRFTPGEKNPKGDAVFTYLTITFSGQGNHTLGSHVTPRVQLDDRMNELCEVKGVQLGQ